MADNGNKIILDLCGGTGSWSNPYREAGYDVRVITLPYFDVSTYEPPAGVYGILAAPPCTQFSFARTNRKTPTNFRVGMKTVEACLQIIRECKYRAWDTGSVSSFKFWAVENPRGYLRHFLGKPVFNFQPYEFGDHHSKSTDLWGYFTIPETKTPVQLTDEEKRNGILNLQALPELPEDYILPPNTTRRAARRAITPPGFADAFFRANS